MTHPSLPTLFVSHGAPSLILEQVPATAFLAGMGAPYAGARAILCVSAHWETPRPAVSAAVQPETIYDFYGFPEALYRVRYPARGDPAVATRVAALLAGAGLPCDVDPQRGLDHGAWSPLTLIYPDAQIPVLQLSIQSHLDPARHLALGEALAPLRHEGILVLGSGGAVHPLGYPAPWSGPPQSWAVAFDDWLVDALTRGDRDALVRYRDLAPHPERAHPRPDHYMPLMVALGAAGPGAETTVLHRSWDLGSFSMAAFRFGA